MRISPFTPLFFINRKADGIESEYVQTFATSDKILLELICAPGETPSVEVRSIDGLHILGDVYMQSWRMNDSVVLWFSEICLPEGEYRVVIEELGASEPFRVTADKGILSDTTLIQYSNRNNRQRTDAVFFIDYMQYFFDFRVHGGFKDSGWTFSVESEQFSTPMSDIVQLYGLESTQKTFTLGNSCGVPVWYGEMLNRILICSEVYFDGVKYSRKEASVPEPTVLIDGVNSFVFTQSLQQSVNLNPVIENNNRLVMRRAAGNLFRSSIANIYRNIE